MRDAPFEASGDGEPVLFVPGFPFGAHVFRQLVPMTAGRFRAVVPDLSDLDDIPAQVSGLRGVVERIGAERCAVIAHGTGGRVAQALAFDGDEVVDTMVLLASPGPTGPVVFPEALDEVLERSHVEPMAAADAEVYLGRWRRDPRAYARGRAALEAGDGVAGLEGPMAAWDRPVLILHGEDDRIVEAAIAERLGAAIPASTLGFVPESGHLLLDDAFASIGAMIVEYLRARYLHAPHDHGGIEMLQMERRPGWVDLARAGADDDGEPSVSDPAEQEVGPNP
jgi:pimeloyl-ACP methyl ester carboxylesterase